MLRLRCGALALALAAYAAAASAHAAPMLFVYKGAGCDGRRLLPGFERFVGRKVDGVSDFVDWTGDWTKMAQSTQWLAGCWRGSGYKLNLSLPMVAKTATAAGLTEVGEGKHDDTFRQIAQTLVKDGFADAYIRIGEEFNQGYYPWSAAGRPVHWVAAYRRVAQVMRDVPGAHFTLVWNPAQYMGQIYPDHVYPGDDVVDVIAQDTYNATWDGDAFDTSHKPIPGKFWSKVYGDSWGLKEFLAFAKKHDKPVAFPEWGTGRRPDGHGGGDDPIFVRNMTAVIADPANRVVFAAYWDYPAPDFNAILSTHAQPQSAAVFLDNLSQTYSPGARVRDVASGASSRTFDGRAGAP